MKILAIAIIAFLFSSIVLAKGGHSGYSSSYSQPSKTSSDVHVNGYTRKDGTYVAPHMKSAPNETKTDNFGTKGNINPYTGKEGTKDPY